MTGQSSIAKRMLLGAVKSLPRDITMAMSDLRKHMEEYFNLRLVWNEISPLTTRMLRFQPSQSVYSCFKAGKFTAKHVQMLSNFWVEHRAQIEWAALPPQYSVDCSSVLVDSRKRQKYRLLFDRALGAVGYLAVEQQGVLPNSHAVVVDLLDDFLESGEPLSSQRLENHLTFALAFLDAAEQEASEKFVEFLNSDDPAAKHPVSFLDHSGSAKLQLLEHSQQLAKLLDISDYARELLSHAEPSEGSLAITDGACLACSAAAADPLLHTGPGPSLSSPPVSPGATGLSRSSTLSPEGRAPFSLLFCTCSAAEHPERPLGSGL
jgi:hypothetical protein